MPSDPPPPAVIAFIWDFDRTLIVGNQQDALFAEYGVDAGTFWAEVEALPAFHRERGECIAADTAYLLHLLSYVDAGAFPGLDNARLRQIGGRLRPSPGIPEFLDATRRHAAALAGGALPGFIVEHYAVSSGLRPMIEGSPVGPFLDGVWACTFVEHSAPPGYLAGVPLPPGAGRIIRPGCVIDHTAKTRAIFEINKGVNVTPEIDVHTNLAEEDRRVPFRQMVYVADGPSDIPVFSVLNARGGRTFGVFQAEPPGNAPQVRALLDQGRIQGMAEADFRPGAAAHRWLMGCLDQIAGEVAAAGQPGAAGTPAPPGSG